MYKRQGLEYDDVVAYLKLRIISAALNEGWEPKFAADEPKFYPFFDLYTKDELEDMQEEDKKGLVIIDTDGHDTEYAGFAFAFSHNARSGTYAYLGSRLCLKTEGLAVYCGKQFIGIWADYLLGRK